MTPSIVRQLPLVLALLCALGPAAAAEKHPGKAKPQPGKATAPVPAKAAQPAKTTGPKHPHPAPVAAKTPPQPPSAPEPKLAIPEIQASPATAPTEPAPHPKTRHAPASAPAPAAPASEADYLAEMEAWRSYQTEMARAWKQYQARTITRAAYDAEVKRSWTAYAAVAGNGAATGTALGNKDAALDQLRLWLDLDFCNTDQAAAAIRRHYGISGPTEDSGPVFAGLLHRFVQTASPETQQRIEREIADYRRQSADDIQDRVERIQANLGTRDIRKAYRGSWCGRT
ncbi:hypothetical protein SAMN02949497_2706 [Methylomagnum ishizawai]|uniref:Uncharacterized protein n=1 Tax=Methylomagnum ishizawai TaxID=1760988 RepID=A0A1Y6D5Y9_9GAMM|nr:hypothetical protein [Methylomagnum ishizawai]SMF95345.1 hypothetical protein SAMN02949497_2706 [Methylomagnum ishizawai]